MPEHVRHDIVRCVILDRQESNAETLHASLRICTSTKPFGSAMKMQAFSQRSPWLLLFRGQLKALLHDELFSVKALNLNEINSALEHAHIHRFVHALRFLLHLHIAQNIDNSDELADR